MVCVQISDSVCAVLTLTAARVGEQLVAAGAGALVGPGYVHTRMSTQLPPLVQPKHLTFIHIWEREHTDILTHTHALTLGMGGIA